MSVDIEGEQELQGLLEREQAPSPLARARFMAALQQEAQRQPSLANGSALLGFFRALWPARPAWGLGYSAALLVAGLVTGQMLPPRSLGLGPQVTEVNLNAERLVQLCAVPPPPAQCVAGQDKC